MHKRWSLHEVVFGGLTGRLLFISEHDEAVALEIAVRSRLRDLSISSPRNPGYGHIILEISYIPNHPPVIPSRNSMLVLLLSDGNLTLSKILSALVFVRI